MTKLSFITNKKNLLPCFALIFILALGLWLRLRHWPDYLTFDYEKARDLIASMKIYQDKKPTLIGPVSEVEGIFHGPLYYYLLGLVGVIWQGDPRSGSIISFSFNLSSIIILFFIAKELFNKKVGLIAAFVYAISFEAISYAYWLSNPGPSVPFLFLMFFFFYKFATKNQKYLIPALFCFGMTIQFQILNVIFALPLLILYFCLGRPKINLKNLVISLAALFLPVSTFILFDLKHQFLMSKTFINQYFTNNHAKTAFKFNPLYYLDRLAAEFSHVLFPTQKLIGILFLLIIISFLFHKVFKEKKRLAWRLLLIWVFSSLPIFFLNSRIGQSSAAFIGVSGGIILSLSLLLDSLFASRKSWLIAALLIPIFFSNFSAIDHCLTRSGCRLFDFFEELFLKRNLTIVKNTYQETKGQSFQLDTVTSPLYISPLWDYLYSWYSRKNLLPPPQRQEIKIHFLVIEPFVNNYFKDQAIREKENLGLKLSKSENYNGVVLQKWQMP
ncbi:MAG: glycosyltransferase family 39 protein [Patescibacteria group bacterium]|nr:glycosyltransferase family 39 protein [Patescibacteria group bacterium]